MIAVRLYVWLCVCRVRTEIDAVVFAHPPLPLLLLEMKKKHRSLFIIAHEIFTITMLFIVIHHIDVVLSVSLSS